MRNWQYKFKGPSRTYRTTYPACVEVRVRLKGPFDSQASDVLIAVYDGGTISMSMNGKVGVYPDDFVEMQRVVEIAKIMLRDSLANV